MSAATAERPLTDQQRAALEPGKGSISLAAGAGCGKTFVLTERFLLHADPTQAEAAGLEELVAITFTDAAAREMRDRIRKLCYERMKSAQPADAAKWQRLMRSIDAARISTIHSFCTQLLREYAVEAGLDPQFEVLDAAAAELLKLETVDERLRTLLLDGNVDVLDLAAKRGLDRLRNDVASLAGPRSHDAIERWIDATPEELVDRWREFYDQQVAPTVLAQLCKAPIWSALRRLCDPALAKSAHLAGRLTELSGVLDALAKCGPADCATLLEDIVKQARVTDIRGAKHWNNLDDYEPFKDACETVRGLVKKSGLSESPDFSAAHEAAEQGLALLRLVADVDYALEEEKTRRNQLEFDDLLARAYRLLTDPAHAAIRQQAAKTTRLLMVDEFQDTNPLQVSIIQAFCGADWRERGLFTVGDFKQSIYRFNGAEPRVSLELREALPSPGRLSLTWNFRSQPAITDFVNAVFEDAFGGYEPLVPTRPQSTPTPAVEFMWTPCEDDGGDG